MKKPQSNTTVEFAGIAVDASNCWRCGDCCKDLERGLKVTEAEWEVVKGAINGLSLEPVTIKEAKRCLRLPTKEENGSRTCVFLRGENVCQVYEKRPEECRRFPVVVLESPNSVTFVVSSICPRAECLTTLFKASLPDWARNLVRDRPYRVALI